MLRDGSGGAGCDGGVGAAGADVGAAADASAEFIGTSNAPAGHARASNTPAGCFAPDPCDANLGQIPRVGRAGADQGEPLWLSRLSAAALAGVGRDELLCVLGDIERLANRLAGYRADVLGALDALSRSGAAPDAVPHLTLRDAAGVSERDARWLIRAAEKAREHDAVLGALSDGDINTAQAETLCDAHVPGAVRAELVAAAARENTDATRRRVRRAEAEHCVETSMERFERQRKARGAGWRRDHEGMLRLWAKFDPDSGAHIEAALEALRRQYWNDDKQVRNGRRTPAQRDADVLAYALAGITYTDADAAAVGRLHARAARRGSRPPGDRPPSRRVTPRNGAAKGTTAVRERPGCAAPEAQAVSNEDLAIGPQLPSAQISVLIDLDALRHQTDDLGLTDAGTELPPEIVRRLACDAEIIPMILGSPGGSADAGRASRTVPLRLRRLLIARDRHCRWPGCAAPPSRCDAHHVWHWIDGGPTNLDNLVLLCHRHHHHLHQHGYCMVPRPDGTWATVQEAEAGPARRRGQPQARAP